MAGVTRAHPIIGDLTSGPHHNGGKDITILAVDFDVDMDGSVEAMIAAVNTIQRYGNILVQGAIHDTGSKMDVIMEGDLSGSDYDSADGTVTGTVGAAMVEDMINLGTIDGVNFASGTSAVAIRTNLITA
jgi:hypothetical protein|tara:strand:+ start:650 stop:1039 length:390 start_codon:yes stop_codon:yes gene_type:complete